MMIRRRLLWAAAGLSVAISIAAIVILLMTDPLLREHGWKLQHPVIELSDEYEVYRRVGKGDVYYLRIKSATDDGHLWATVDFSNKRFYLGVNETTAPREFLGYFYLPEDAPYGADFTDAMASRWDASRVEVHHRGIEVPGEADRIVFWKGD